MHRPIRPFVPMTIAVALLLCAGACARPTGVDAGQPVGAGTATDSVDSAQSPLSNSLILTPQPADLTSNVGALPLRISVARPGGHATDGELAWLADRVVLHQQDGKAVKVSTQIHAAVPSEVARNSEGKGPDATGGSTGSPGTDAFIEVVPAAPLAPVWHEFGVSDLPPDVAAMAGTGFASKAQFGALGVRFHPLSAPVVRMIAACDVATGEGIGGQVAFSEDVVTGTWGAFQVRAAEQSCTVEIGKTPTWLVGFDCPGATASGPWTMTLGSGAYAATGAPIGFWNSSAADYKLDFADNPVVSGCRMLWF